MAASLTKSFENIGQTFSSWSTKRQITTALSVFGGILLFAGILMWATTSNYAPLMSNLQAEDAAQIIDRLNTEHVPYKLTANGTAIWVPEDKVYDTRLRLAGEGLPRGGNVGFELFDSPNFGMSRFTEQLNYKRGLEGELARSIRQLDAVKDVRVHIVIPEQGLFREQDKAATAAVTLQLQPGRALSKGQIQAVVHLVASSVAGLAPDHVTVVDGAGNILARGGDTAQGMSGNLEQQRAIEQSLEERVQAILSPIVGAGHVVVRASVTLDHARTERTTETYDPTSSVLRSEQTSKETRTSPQGNAMGVPGSRSNLSGADNKVDGTATQQSQAAASNSERQAQTHNFEINKVLQHEIGGSGGRLARLSVAVLVDGISKTNDKGETIVQERSPEELERFADLVRRAVGFDADRDDQVVVQSMAFEKPLAAAELAETPRPMWLEYVRQLWLPILAFLALVAVVLGIRRMQSAPVDNPVLDRPRTVRELEAAMGGFQGGVGMPGLASAPSMAALGPGTPKATNEIVPVEPKRAASVLKSWLSED